MNTGPDFRTKIHHMTKTSIVKIPVIGLPAGEAGFGLAFA